ncbi:diguanylate cyclase, partial [Candidatus Marithioploca araucensis]|nr:diguanylate cyclase [Candidatus Marithioploca araucensis]
LLRQTRLLVTLGDKQQNRLTDLAEWLQYNNIKLQNKAISAVYASEKKLAQFLEAVSVGVFVVDAKGKPYYANKKAQEILGKDIVQSSSDEEPEVYQTYLAGTAQLYPKERHPIVQALKGKTSSVDDVEVFQNKQVIPIEIWGTPIFDEQGNIAYAITAFQDITERKRAEAEREEFTKALQESEERFRVIAETTPVPLMIIRPTDGAILYANLQTTLLFGFSISQIMDSRITDLYLNTAAHEKLLEIFNQKGCVRNYELKMKKIDTTPLCATLFVQKIIFKHEKVLLIAIYDLTERKQAEADKLMFAQEREAKNVALQMKGEIETKNEQLQQEIKERQRAEVALEKANKELERMAIIDELTQVANRRRLNQCLTIECKRMAREQKPLSFIFCDIDYFKHYNDTYGHQAGDACLQQIALVMNNAVRRASDLVARYGGEEFAVILPNTEAEGAVNIATAIQKKLERLKIVHAESEDNQYVTLSIGVSCTIPHHTISPEILIKTADDALYEAKARGRNRIILKML